MNTSDKKKQKVENRFCFCTEAGEELAKWMADILQLPFFKHACEEREREFVLLQTMFLMDNKETDKNYQPLSSYSEAVDYCCRAREHFTVSKREIIRCLIEYLSEAFPEGHAAIKGENAPMLVLVSDIVMQHGVPPLEFKSFIDSLAYCWLSPSI